MEPLGILSNYFHFSTLGPNDPRHSLCKERNASPASLPLKYSPRRVGKGFQSQLLAQRHHRCPCPLPTFVSLFLLLLACFQVSSAAAWLFSFIPNFQLCAFILLFPLLLCYLCICLGIRATSCACIQHFPQGNNSRTPAFSCSTFISKGLPWVSKGKLPY